MKKLNLLINFLSAFLLFGFALWGLKSKSFLGLDKEGLATFCGALFGAGALFLGNQINYYFKILDESEALKEKQKTLRTILVGEIISIFVPHTQEAYSYNHKQELFDGGILDSPIHFNSSYRIPKPNIFNSLTTQLLILPSIEIKAISNLYYNLSLTREELYDEQKSQPTSSVPVITFSKLKNSINNDCMNAHEVVKMMEPNTQITKPNGDTLLFCDLLKKPHKIS